MEIEQLMLKAIVSNETDENTEAVVSLYQQREYIKRYINSVTVEERVHVANLIVYNDQKKLMKECKEGTIINLNAIPSNIITQMYELLKYKIDKIQRD